MEYTPHGREGAEPVEVVIAAAAAFAVVLIAVLVAHQRRTLSGPPLEELLETTEPWLAECRTWKALVEQGLANGVSAGRWIPHETWQPWLANKPKPRAVIRKLARQADAGGEARALLAFLAEDLEALVAAANRQILTDELARRRSFFDTIEKQRLTDEQATAVVTFDNRVQLVAAAGAGKTSVMVARAAYSILRGFVPAERILLLAFNRDAAAELLERVDARLSAAGIDPTGLKAATFHAFGLTVIGQATGRKQRLASWLNGGQDAAMTDQIVDELRDLSPSFRFRWDTYRLLFARMADGPDGGEPDGYDYGSKQTGFRTFNGETVRSQGERMIADFLFLNGVRYEYERPYSHDVADAEHSQYRPNFYYPDVDVWHEHWALDRNGRPPAEFKGYAEGMGSLQP